jgi:hypothetical protein
VRLLFSFGAEGACSTELKHLPSRRRLTLEPINHDLSTALRDALMVIDGILNCCCTRVSMALSVPRVFSISSRMRITPSSISSPEILEYSLPPTGSVVLVTRVS